MYCSSQKMGCIRPRKEGAEIELQNLWARIEIKIKIKIHICKTNKNESK